MQLIYIVHLFMNAIKPIQLNIVTEKKNTVDNSFLLNTILFSLVNFQPWNEP